MSALGEIGTRLSAKAGPLKVWQWAAVGGAGVGALLIMKGGGIGGGSQGGSEVAGTGLVGGIGAGDAVASVPAEGSAGPTLYGSPSPMPIVISSPAPTITPSAFGLTTPQVIPSPVAHPAPVGFETNVVTLQSGVNSPAAPIIPGTDWSPAAVAGYFAQGGDAFHRFGLSETPTGSPAVFTQTSSSFDVTYGTTKGSVSPTQRFIGYAPGTNVPIFQ